MVSSGFGPLRWVSFPVSWPTSGPSSPCIVQDVLPKEEEGGGKKMTRNSHEYSAVSRLIDKTRLRKLSATIGLDNYLVFSSSVI